MTEQPKNDQARFTVRLDKDLHKSFVSIARQNDRNPSQLVREFMREYIKKNRQSELHF